MEHGNESPLDFAEKQRLHYKEKSDKNKRRSTWLFFIVVLATVLAPVLILLTDNYYLSKLLPAVLTAVAGITSYWVQLKKPAEKWRLYRTAQRLIEYEINEYKFILNDYSETNRNSLLAERVNKISIGTHNSWMPLVPVREDLPQNKEKENDI